MEYHSTILYSNTMIFYGQKKKNIHRRNERIIFSFQLKKFKHTKYSLSWDVCPSARARDRCVCFQ